MPVPLLSLLLHPPLHQQGPPIPPFEPPDLIYLLTPTLSLKVLVLAAVTLVTWRSRSAGSSSGSREEEEHLTSEELPLYLMVAMATS